MPRRDQGGAGPSRSTRRDTGSGSRRRDQAPPVTETKDSGSWWRSPGSILDAAVHHAYLGNPFGQAGFLAEKTGLPVVSDIGRVAEVLTNAPFEAIRHPALTARQGVGMGVGLVEAPYGIYKARTGGSLNPLHYGRKQYGGMNWKEIGGMMAKGAIEDYKARYGKDWREQAEKEPLSNLLDAISVLGVGARAAALAGAASRLEAAGMSATAVRKLWKESSRPGVVSTGHVDEAGDFVEGEAFPRVTTYHPETGDPISSTQEWSGSPLRRGTQKLSQALSEQFPEARAFGARSRVTRAQASQLRRQVDRFLSGATNVPAINALSEAEKTRLFWGSQLGDHSPEMLKRLRDALLDEHTGEGPDWQWDEDIASQVEPNFHQWLWEAKQAGFGKVLRERLDKAIAVAEKSPTQEEWTPRYRSALEAMREMTNISEQVIRDSEGFTTLHNDIKRATDRLAELEPNHPDVKRLQGEISDMQTELADKTRQLNEMFGKRRGRLRGWLDSRAVRNSAERKAWEQVLTERFGPEQAAEGLRIADIRANVARPSDPASYWRDRIGMPTDEGAADFMSRVDEAAAQFQVPFSLSRKVSPEVAAENLRYVEGGDLYKPNLGRQKNGKVFRTINGQRVQILGRITPAEWVKRIVAVVPDIAERTALARWYEQVAPTFERFFGEDAEAILRGFTVSQANASPTSGLQATLRVFDKLQTGQEIDPLEISAVVKSIEKAVEGQHVSKGLAAKLHDFADSIEGKTTRTWMGDDPRGGRPTANDVHAIRDLGYVDKKLAARLRNPEPKALFKKGVDDFEIDSGGSPGTHQYERMREQYEEITDYLNTMDDGKGFDGRNDWKPAEVQALGWSGIQRVHGAYPENLMDAVGNNTRRVNLEVTKGATGIGDELTPAEAAIVARHVEGVVSDMVEETDGLYLDSHVQTGVSGFGDSLNASIHFNVIGSPERAQALIDRLGNAFDQVDVWATRSSSSTGSKPTLHIYSSELGDPEKATALYNELRGVDGKKFTGFATIAGEDGTPGISLVMPGKAITEVEVDAFEAAHRELLDGAVDRALGDVEYNYGAGNTQILSSKKGLKHRGKGEVLRTDEAQSGRPLDDPLASEARARLEQGISRVHTARGGARHADADAAGPEGLAPRFQHRPESRRFELVDENGKRVELYPDEYDSADARYLIRAAEEQGVKAEMRELPQQPRMQRPDWKELPKGATEFLDGNTAIRLFEGADITTWIHELGHIALHDLDGEDLATLEQHFASGKKYADWTDAEHEDFARSWENYFRTGQAPTRELDGTFSKIANWVKHVWREEKIQSIPMHPEVRDVFDNLLVGHEPDVFIPHRATRPARGGARSSRGIPRADKVLGDSVRSRIPMFRRNELALMRSGMLNDDPRQLIEHVNRVLMLARANQLREAVLEMGVKLQPGHQPDFETQYVVKKTGRSVDKPAFDALEAADDPAEIRQTVQNFIDDHITDDRQKWEAWGGTRPDGSPEHQLYVVDKRVVDSLFKNVTGKTPGATTKPATTTTKILDASLDSVRGLLLYANPGFYVANMVGNGLMLGMSSPSGYRDMAWSMKQAVKAATHEETADPRWHRMSTEMGRGPTSGGISEGPQILGEREGVIKGVRKAIKDRPPGTVGNIAESVSHTWGNWGRRSGRIIDDSWRVAAWKAAARKRGIKTDKQIDDLFDEATDSATRLMEPKTKADRTLNAIRDEAEQLMLDFDSMTPFEKTYLTRIIFLYPFLKASAKWPFMYAGERPLVTGVGGQAALQAQNFGEETLGPRPELPAWLEGAARGPGGYWPIGSVLPMAMAADLLQSAAHVGQPAEVGIQTPYEFQNPLTQLVLDLAHGRNRYGTPANAGEILRQEFPAPAWMRYPWKKPSQTYTERDFWNTLLRAARGPFQVNEGQAGGG